MRGMITAVALVLVASTTALAETPKGAKPQAGNKGASPAKPNGSDGAEIEMDSDKGGAVNADEIQMEDEQPKPGIEIGSAGEDPGAAVVAFWQPVGRQGQRQLEATQLQAGPLTRELLVQGMIDGAEFQGAIAPVQEPTNAVLRPVHAALRPVL